MIDAFILLIFSVLIYFINNIFKKKSILSNYTGEVHQTLTSKKGKPLTGGLFLLIGYLYFFYNQTFSLNIFIVLIFAIGIISDLKILKSPNKRFFIQMLVIVFFVILNDLELSNTKILLLDKILEFQIINYFFIVFCILVVVNGTNFIDGLNTLVIGYYLILTFIIYYLNLYEFLGLNSEQIFFWLIFCIVIFFYNLFNKFYLGDSGSYLLGFIYGYLLLLIYQNNQIISPFFIIILLWYPAFENLFSILRKISMTKSPLKPDQNHLHQLIYLYLKKKNKVKKKYLNSFSAQIINLYNLFIFILASQAIQNTQYQIFLVIVNILVYCFLYSKLLHHKLKKGHVVQW